MQGSWPLLTLLLILPLLLLILSLMLLLVSSSHCSFSCFSLPHPPLVALLLILSFSSTSSRLQLSCQARFSHRDFSCWHSCQTHLRPQTRALLPDTSQPPRPQMPALLPDTSQVSGADTPARHISSLRRRRPGTAPIFFCDCEHLLKTLDTTSPEAFQVTWTPTLTSRW